MNISMAFGQSMGVEGIVAFGSNASDSFRYRLGLKDDKVNIWLENRKSKKQWETGELGMKDFVPEDGVIPHAKIADYVTCFHNALECSLEGSTGEESHRELNYLKNGHLSLEFTLKLKVFASVWTPTYKFDLKSIPLEKVDLLESKLRDQEEELVKLRDAQAISKPIFLHVVSQDSVYANSAVTWSAGGGDDFKIYPSGEIEVLNPGVYMIHVVLLHRNTNNGKAYCLMKGGHEVASCYDSSGNSHNMASPLMMTLELKANEKISVTYSGSSQATIGSTLTAFLLQ